MKKQKLYAVIGYPLSHSLSPIMHNAAFKRLNMNARYFPFEIPVADFKNVLNDFRRLPLCGCNVTVPYKEKMLSFVDVLSKEAKIIGAVNTIKFGKKAVGFNTDAYGFIRSLQEDLGFFAKKKRVLILGAGGAARACLFGLAQTGAQSITIANRTEVKAKRLANDFSGCFRKVDFGFACLDRAVLKEIIFDVDLVVNTTSVGLKKGDCSLISTALFKQVKPAVYDLIYNPAKTNFIFAAEKAGCLVANGINMLLYQGVKAFEIWTKKKAPVDVMRRALLQDRYALTLRECEINKFDSAVD